MLYEVITASVRQGVGGIHLPEVDGEFAAVVRQDAGGDELGIPARQLRQLGTDHLAACPEKGGVVHLEMDSYNFV